MKKQKQNLLKYLLPIFLLVILLSMLHVNAATTRVECENMTLGGTYAGKITTPFSGVALYANNDNCATNYNFTSSPNTISVRGCSNNSSTAQIAVLIGGTQVGTLNFTGTTPSVQTLSNINTGTGMKELRITVTTDIGTWDAYVDYVEVSNSNPTPTPTPTPSGSYVRFRNVATSLYFDGMGSTANGSNACQYSSGSSNNQQWTIINSGSYVMIQNRATGLYLDGMGRTSNGSICGQWAGSGSTNQQWTQETVGSYVKFKNRATGLYLDGMGSTANGSNLCQYSSSSSTNQQWQIVTSTPTPTTTPTPTPTGSKFHCFLLLGQSNMAGFALAQASDKVEDPRVLVLGYDNNPALGRVTDKWDVACPPLHPAWLDAIGPGDWFGKTMIQKVRSGDTIGLIPCAISGEKIETFMKVGGTKYSWIINRAKIAQQSGGIIEGIIFHQGESNSGDTSWPGKVKTLVTDLRNDLGLGNVPFLPGELLYGGACAGHNTLVNQLPSLISNCYVISASGLVKDPTDTYNLHFSHDSSVELGKRYATKMIQVLGW